MKVIKICSASRYSIGRKSRLRIRIRRENNIIQIGLPDGSTLPLARMFRYGRCLGYSAPIR